MTVLLIIIAILFFPVSITAWIFMLCWNYLDSTIFHLRTLTFWQAFAMAFLLAIIGGAFSSKSAS